MDTLVIRMTRSTDSAVSMTRITCPGRKYRDRNEVLNRTSNRGADVAQHEFREPGRGRVGVVERGEVVRLVVAVAQEFALHVGTGGPGLLLQAVVAVVGVGAGVVGGLVVQGPGLEHELAEVVLHDAVNAPGVVVLHHHAPLSVRSAAQGRVRDGGDLLDEAAQLGLGLHGVVEEPPIVRAVHGPAVEGLLVDFAVRDSGVAQCVVHDGPPGSRPPPCRRPPWWTGRCSRPRCARPRARAGPGRCRTGCGWSPRSRCR